MGPNEGPGIEATSQPSRHPARIDQPERATRRSDLRRARSTLRPSSATARRRRCSRHRPRPTGPGRPRRRLHGWRGDPRENAVNTPADAWLPAHSTLHQTRLDGHADRLGGGLDERHVRLVQHQAVQLPGVHPVFGEQRLGCLGAEPDHLLEGVPGVAPERAAPRGEHPIGELAVAHQLDAEHLEGTARPRLPVQEQRRPGVPPEHGRPPVRVVGPGRGWSATQTAALRSRSSIANWPIVVASPKSDVAQTAPTSKATAPGLDAWARKAALAGLMLSGKLEPDTIRSRSGPAQPSSSSADCNAVIARSTADSCGPSRRRLSIPRCFLLQPGLSPGIAASSRSLGTSVVGWA